jgi:hypothetical protein
MGDRQIQPRSSETRPPKQNSLQSLERHERLASLQRHNPEQVTEVDVLGQQDVAPHQDLKGSSRVLASAGCVDPLEQVSETRICKGRP